MGQLHQPSNVGFTSKARRVGTLLFRARSSQVTGVHTQNKVMQPQSDVQNDRETKVMFTQHLRQDKGSRPDQKTARLKTSKG
jgi:hypothetical protein